jgi:glycosyltransferase involved in cell wall biosynthesis
MRGDAEMVEPLVSVIVPTFNSEGTLKKCLQSIRDQIYSNVEVLVIDSYSSDSTVEIAKAFDAEVLLRRCGRSGARNYGAEMASGLFVLFVDSDQELTARVVSECVEKCLVESAEAVIIPEESLTRDFLSECRKMEKSFHAGNELFEAPRFFKKDAFRALGGYDVSLTFGEDLDLYQRAQKEGCKTVRVEAWILHDEGRLDMKKIVIRALYYGKSMPFLFKKNASLATRRYLPTSKEFSRGARALINDPLHFTGLAIIKTVEYETYIAGIITRPLEKTEPSVR